MSKRKVDNKNPIIGNKRSAFEPYKHKPTIRTIPPIAQETLSLNDFFLIQHPKALTYLGQLKLWSLSFNPKIHTMGKYFLSNLKSEKKVQNADETKFQKNDKLPIRFKKSTKLTDMVSNGSKNNFHMNPLAPL